MKTGSSHPQWLKECQKNVEDPLYPYKETICFVFTEICVNKETVFKELFAQLREGGKSMWVRILERNTWPSK